MLIFGKNVPWQNSCCQRDPCAKYELCQTKDERETAVKFFPRCRNEKVYFWILYGFLQLHTNSKTIVSCL